MALRIGSEIPSLDGATEWINGNAAASDLIGSPTIIYFWAVSCHICEENMPTLLKWRQTYGEFGVRFIGVHMPRQESDTDVAAVKAAVLQHQITNSCAIDNYHEIGERFETSGYWPYYFLFDAEGRMKSRAAGDVGLASIESALKRLLEG